MIEHAAVMPIFTSFDVRTVRYEEIHSIASADFDSLTSSAQVSPGEIVMDCGCGYGAVTRELVSRVDADVLKDLTIDLVDESSYQLDRARNELAAWIGREGSPRLKLICAAFPREFGSLRRYDVILAKMVLHEVSRGAQHEFIQGLFSNLADRGRLLLWDVCLSETTAHFYRKIIRLKDELAGFETMVDRRHFLTCADIRSIFAESSFGSVELIRPMIYRFRSLKRLGPELRGDRRALGKLNEAIRAAVDLLDREVRQELAFQDDGDDVSFQINKGIFLATRESK